MLITVIVTFNRKYDLLMNIKRQLIQKEKIDHIIVVDNHSSDGTYDFIRGQEFFNESKIKYFYLNDNVGGAGGFEFGVKQAYKLGADYIVMMDDDGYMLDDITLQQLISHIPQRQELVMLNSLVLVSNDRLSFGLGWGNSATETIKKADENGYIFKHINPFNGTLISRGLIEKIGFPNGQFFIKGDEVDYQNRALAVKAFVATVVTSRYYHPTPITGETIVFFGKKFVNNIEEPWKEYYTVRNSCYRALKISYVKGFKCVLRRILTLLLFRPLNMLLILKFILVGYRHAIVGKLGKIVLPGQTKI